MINNKLLYKQIPHDLFEHILVFFWKFIGSWLLFFIVVIRVYHACFGWDFATKVVRRGVRLGSEQWVPWGDLEVFHLWPYKIVNSRFLSGFVNFLRHRGCYILMSIYIRILLNKRNEKNIGCFDNIRIRFHSYEKDVCQCIWVYYILRFAFWMWLLETWLHDCIWFMFLWNTLLVNTF